jgi:replication initiation and membrane attachment protein DnaB
MKNVQLLTEEQFEIILTDVALGKLPDLSTAYKVTQDQMEELIMATIKSDVDFYKGDLVRVFVDWNFRVVDGEEDIDE